MLWTLLGDIDTACFGLYLEIQHALDSTWRYSMLWTLLGDTACFGLCLEIQQCHALDSAWRYSMLWNISLVAKPDAVTTFIFKR